MAEFRFKLYCGDNIAYLFGGGSAYNGYFNNLSILDLSSSNLEFKIIAKT